MKQFKLDIGDLITRIIENKDNNVDPIYSNKVAEKVINARTVLISNTFHRENFLMQNKLYYDKLVISNKYFPQPMLFYVKKIAFLK